MDEPRSKEDIAIGVRVEARVRSSHCVCHKVNAKLVSHF